MFESPDRKTYMAWHPPSRTIQAAQLGHARAPMACKACRVKSSMVWFAALDAKAAGAKGRANNRSAVSAVKAVRQVGHDGLALGFCSHVVNHWFQQGRQNECGQQEEGKSSSLRSIQIGHDESDRIDGLASMNDIVKIG